MANSKMSSTDVKGDKHLPDYDERFLSDDENEVRIVLVGRTGSGISSSGNTILQQQFFQTDTSGSSVTKCCEVGTIKINDTVVKVVDTPGLFGNLLAIDEIKREIMNCFKLTFPGPHVILYVLRIGRFTNEEVSSVKRFLEIFGGNPMQNTILLFTGEDDLEWNKSSKEEYIGNAPVYLRQLVEFCGGRYVFINNRVSNSLDSVNQVNELFRVVDNLIKQNPSKLPYYTNQIFEQFKDDSRFSEHDIRIFSLKLAGSALCVTGILVCVPSLYPIVLVGVAYAGLSYYKNWKKADDNFDKVIEELKDENTALCTIS